MQDLSDSAVIRAEVLSGLPGIDHGFGTRETPPRSDLAWLKQIHSNRIAVADRSGNLGEGDALVTSTPGVVVSVRTADCVPVLLADPEAGVVAAVHAGWRGVVSEIVPNAVSEMARLGANPARVRAAIGPAIGLCCFEVGSEVAEQFRNLFPERHDLDAKVHIDLAEAIRRQLARAGLSETLTETVGLCTKCETQRLHSFRRDGALAGRQVSWIGIAGVRP